MRPQNWLYTIPLRLRSLFRWAQADQELDDELRDHLDFSRSHWLNRPTDGRVFPERQMSPRPRIVVEVRIKNPA